MRYNIHTPAWVAKIRDFHLREHSPENNLTFRVLCVATCLLSVVAVLQQLEWPLYSLPALFAIIVGNTLSYRFRQKPVYFMKLIISAYMLGVLYNFFVDLASETDTRLPLAKLLIFLYQAHSFDVPRRKDLYYSLLVSFILIVMCAVLTTDMTLVFYLPVYCVLAFTTAIYGHASHCREMCPVTPDVRISYSGGKTSLPIRRSLSFLCSAMFTGALFCCFMPKFDSLRLQALPSSWNMRIHFPTVSKGEIVNPSSGTSDGSNWAKQNFDSDLDSFNASVNLNQRFTPSKEKVMLLRTNRWCYLRGLTFQDYDGHHWSVSNDLSELKCDNPPFIVPQYFPSDFNNRIVQIIQMERDMPNLIFAAYSPVNLYLPTNIVYLDAAMNLRVPFLLEKGTVYSAISQAPAHSPQSMLMMARWIRYDPNDEHYMKNYVKASQKHYKRVKLHEQQQKFLPLPSCISERTKELARLITRQSRNDFQRAFELADYLRNNYTYQLVPPPYPRDREVCDYFLFDSKVGNCQQFATSLVVMARSLGIPARFVTGFAPSQYNPLTGYYEIRGCDAHAWAEVCLPPVGWIEFEPTPAQGDNALPLPEESPSRPLFAQQLADFIGSMLSAKQVMWIQITIHRLLKILSIVWRPFLALTLVLGLYKAGKSGWRWGRNRWKRATDSGHWDSISLNLHRIRDLAKRFSWPAKRSISQLTEAEYRDLLILIQQHGCSRLPHQTMRRFSLLTARELQLPELETICELWERRHYGNIDNAGEWEELRSLVKTATEQLKNRSYPTLKNGPVS